MDDWLPPLPDALPRVVTRTSALRCGFTVAQIERRLRTGTWTRILPSTYLTVDTLTWLDRQRAALAYSGGRAVLSGAAALADLGLRSVRRPDTVLVLVPQGTRRRSAEWVRVRPTRRLPAADLRPGPAKAPIARAVADLALETRRLDDVRALVAEVVRRGHCAVAELDAELATGPRGGSAHLRLALEEVGGGAWSAPEALAARLLTAAGVPPFRQNIALRLPGGDYMYLDFLWPRLRAVLEIDSDEHHGLPADADATDGRHITLESLGLSVAHRRPSFIARRPKQFTDGISAWLAARARELGRA